MTEASTPIVGMMDMKPGDMIYDMQMTFGFTKNAGWFLFEGFKVEDYGTFVAALLVILAMALATEGLSFLLWRQKFNRQKDSKMGSVEQVLDSVMYFALRLLNYSQMLVAMTFNFWLIVMIAVFQFVAWYMFQDIKDGMVI